MANSRKPKAVLNDLPIDEIKKLRDEGTQQVSVRVWRVAAGNRKESLGYTSWDVQDIGGQRFMDDIKGQHGGGRYHIEILNPDDLLERLVPTFMLEFKGEPKLSHEQQAKYDEAMRNSVLRGGPPPPMSEFLKTPGGAPIIRPGAGSTVNPEIFDPRRYWENTPDAAYRKQAEEAAKKVDQLEKLREADRQKYEDERRRYEDLLKQTQSQIDAVREENRKEREDMRQKALEEKIKQMEVERSKPPAIDYAALLTAAVPLVVQVMQSSQTRDELRQKHEAKAAEAQQKSTDAMLKLMSNKTTSETETLKALMPMVTKAMDDKSPAKQASLISTMSEHQATMISMVHQIMQANQPENPPPWMEFANTMIGQLSQVAQTYAETQAGMSDHQPVAAALQSRVQPELPQHTDQQQTPADIISQMTPEQLAQGLLLNPNWPVELKNDKWQLLLEFLHDRRDPEQMGQFVAEQVDVLVQQDQLPEIFDGIYDTPDAVLIQFLAMLPIYQVDRAYCQRVADYFGQVVRQAEAMQQTDDAQAGPTNGAEEYEGEIVDSPPPDVVPENIAP